VLENVTLPSRRPLEEMEQLRKAQHRAEKTLGGDGRVLVRWSGTEPKLRIMVEGPDAAKIRSFAKDMADAARKDVPASG
jgi:phosphoglucosamine mutase